MVAAGTANAAAIAAASMPSTVCNISGVRQLAAIAGCAHTSMSSSRRSGIASSSGILSTNSVVSEYVSGSGEAIR